MRVSSFALRRINDACREAIDLHPIFPGDQLRAVRILAEEIGEVAKAVGDIQAIAAGIDKLSDNQSMARRAAVHHLVVEVAQVGATAARWLERLVEDEPWLTPSS